MEKLMDVDDVDSSLDIFGRSPIELDIHRLADAIFFNFLEMNLMMNKFGIVLC
ncbi:hypothetical protein F511_09756 [Dorcoceras hygrometricum]|uniref:Uncharacterized protein n=1 Tax=Dorcoceras hygrometricum TaxID=472368 RepID=A0A2Z7DBN3_9LAMI|nr:hypothetical protein F511_09756 [Dorcoceras hygrometricum]